MSKVLNPLGYSVLSLEIAERQQASFGVADLESTPDVIEPDLLTDEHALSEGNVKGFGNPKLSR